MTILEKLAEQLQTLCDITPFQMFTKKLADHRLLIAELGKKMNQMINSPERADREQRQEVTQAKRAYREQERAIEDVVKVFYALAETFQPERLVVMLDTSEWLSDPGEDETNRVGEWIMNSLLPELHQRMQQRGRRCLFVITSRNRLHVDKMNKQDVIEHTLPPLEQAEAEQYLQQKGMRDTALCKQVYKISHGHPFSLMLIAELWQRQKEQPASFLTFLDEQQGLDTSALRGYLGERLLDKNLAEPLNKLTRYGVLLRKFDLPMLQAVFPKFFSKGKEQQQFTQLISASYILPIEKYYAFDDLMRETLATRVRIHEPKKWLMYHQRAWKYLSELSSRHGTLYPVNGYYHAIAYNEKSGMDEWVGAIRKAFADGTREVLGALFLVAYDETLDLSPSARAVRAYEQGHFYYADQQWDEALKYYKQALDFHKQAAKKKKAENTAGPVWVYVGMADVQRFRPDRNLEAALDYYQQAYDLYVGMDDKGVDNLLNQAHRLHEIGEVLRLQEKLDAALESYSKALAIFQGFGYYQDMAYVHRSMAEALAQLSPNSKEAAVEHYQQALELLPGEWDLAGRAEMCKALGDLQREQQNWAAALQAYEQGLHFYQWENNLIGQATLYQRMGEAEQARGQEITALEHYESALKFYAHHKEELKSRSKEDVDYSTVQAGEAEVYWAIGRIEQQRRKWDDALKNFEFAANVYRELGDEAKREDVGKARWETLRCMKWLQAIDERVVKKLWEYLDRADRQGAAQTCKQIGEELRKHGEDMALVLEAYQHARWYYGELWDKQGQAYASEQIAEIERSWGGLETAYADYRLALQAYSDVNDKRGMAYICQRMGEVEQSRSDLEQALQSFGDACKYYQQLGDKAGEAYVQKASGKIEQVRNKWEKARMYYHVALVLFQNLSDRAEEADVRKALGEVEQASANWSEAQKQYEAAKKIYHEELKDRLIEAYLCRVIGDVLIAQQQWEMARQSYNQALNFYEHEEKPDEQAHIYQGRGDAQKKDGKLDEALKDYQQAANLYDMLKDYLGMAATYKAIAEIRQTHRDPEDLETARKTFKKAVVMKRIVAGDQQTKPAPPLVASARVILEKDEHDDKYVLQVRIAQKQRKESGNKKTEAESEKVRDVVNPLVIGIKLHADSTINWLESKDEQLLYNPHDSEQQIEIPFKVEAAGHHTLDVDFTHKQRWVGTIRLEFDAIEQPLGSTPTPKKWKELELLVPPLQDDFKVDVFLTIRMEGNQYQVRIISDRGATKYFPMTNILPQDVSDMNIRLQCAIEQVSQTAENVNLATREEGNFDKEFFEEAKAFYDEALYNLMVEGKHAWETIFANERGQDVVRKVLKPGATIQIVVDPLDSFSIPWELLYDGPWTKKADVSHFWGMRYHIVRLLEFEKWPPEVIRVIRPTIGFIRDKDLEAAEKEWKELKTWTNINCVPLRDLDAHRHFDEFQYLMGQFLSDKELQILHFACHAGTEATIGLYLRVSDNFQIRLHEIDRKFRLAHHPLVILNACRTGIVDPLRTSNWVTLFWDRGACGIVATEARVLDEFAARFSKKIYELLLTGKKIGEVLFVARRYFCEVEDDPSGLAYALYASPSLRIEYRNQRRKSHERDNFEQ